MVLHFTPLSTKGYTEEQTQIWIVCKDKQFACLRKYDKKKTHLSDFNLMRVTVVDPLVH